MGVLPIPSCDLATLRRRLYDEYAIEIPLTAWNGQQFVRLSVQGYNTRSDVELLIEALATLLPEVTMSRCALWSTAILVLSGQGGGMATHILQDKALRVQVDLGTL